MTYKKFICETLVFMVTAGAISPARIILGQRQASHLPLDQLVGLRAFEVSLSEVRQAQTPKLVDRFGPVTSNDEKARLDNFAIELQQDPRVTGYILVYGRRGGRRYDAKKRADAAKRYLVYYNRTNNPLVSLDHCFASKVQYELWIVPDPKNHPPPYCTKR